jgi:TonB family protein
MKPRLVTLCLLCACLALAAKAQDQGQAANPRAGDTQAPSLGAPSEPQVAHPARIRVAGNVVAAKLIYQVPPIYPPDAKAAHVQGTVLLHVIIAKDGSVQNMQVVSGPPMLIPAATDAVQQWRYRPTTLNGEPVGIDSTIQVVFTLGRFGEAAGEQSGTPSPEGEPSTVQHDSQPIDPQLKADILELFEAMGMNAKATEVGRALIPSIRPLLLASLPPTPHREEIVDAYGERLLAIFSSQEFVDRSMAVYAKYFSDEDIRALTEFYQTSAGHRFNEVQGNLAAEGSQIGQDMALKALPGIMKSLCHDYPELQGAANFCTSETKEKKSLLIAPPAQLPGSANGN